MSASRGWQDRLGRRFARLAVSSVVARPELWRVFRRPLAWQFGRLAASWEGRRGPESLAPFAAALDRIGEARHVLDLGTGTGKGARLVAARFPQATVVGVDLSPEMVAQARANLPAELAGRVRFEVGDAAALPFADGSFDLVCLLNMIPFFPELARLTAPGGTAVLAFSSGASTPIYVPPETLRQRLAPLGFGDFAELAAGTGIALLARRSEASRARAGQGHGSPTRSG